MAEDPQVEETKPTETDDAKELMEELKRLNIETPADVQNMASASADTGKAWNEVGVLRKEVERLNRLTQDLQKPSQPAQYDEGYGESVDLGTVVKKEVQGVLNDYLAGQQRSQQMAMKVMSEVKSDPDYQIVGDVFEKFVNMPETILRLQSGETDYKTEYLNTKTAYYRNLAKRSASTLEGLMDKSAKTPPHMEQGDSQTTPMPQLDDEKREQFNKIKKAQKEGTVSSDQALDDIVKSVMPDLKNDPGFFVP